MNDRSFIGPEAVIASWIHRQSSTQRELGNSSRRESCNSPGSMNEGAELSIEKESFVKRFTSFLAADVAEVSRRAKASIHADE